MPSKETISNWLAGETEADLIAKCAGMRAPSRDRLLSSGFAVADGVTWYFRKWTSGRTDAFATLKAVKVSTAADADFGYSVKVAATSYPAGLFAATPRVYMTARGALGYPMLDGLGSKGKTPAMRLCRPSAASGITVYFDLYAHGKWV